MPGASAIACSRGGNRYRRQGYSGAPEPWWRHITAIAMNNAMPVSLSSRPPIPKSRQPTDAEIKAEYEANPAAYTAPEYRSIAVMKVEPSRSSPPRSNCADADDRSWLRQIQGRLFHAGDSAPSCRSRFRRSMRPRRPRTRSRRERISSPLPRNADLPRADVTFADKTKADFFDPAIAEAAFSLAEGAVSEPIKGALATVLLKADKDNARAPVDAG